MEIKKLRLSVSLILTTILCIFATMPILAESAVKAGDTIRVPIQIISNPGICSARIKIEYDKEIFTMLSQENGDIFPISSFVAGNADSDDCYAVWVGLTDINKTGTLLYIDFKVNDAAPNGEYGLAVSYDENDVFNLDENNIKIKIDTPIITIGNDTKNDTTSSSSGGAAAHKTNSVKNNSVVVMENIKEGSLSNFQKQREYKDGFNDVAKSDWFYDYIKSGYEYMLVNGKSDTEFDPAGNITVAEAITLASTIRTIYFEEPLIKNSDNDVWYENFVDYAIQNGIIDKNFFDSYDRAILRKEMAYIFSNALTGECYENINILQEIPDMQKDDAYYNYVSKLYISGILTGDDDAGAFRGERPISRCETAAIADRLAIPTLRITR